MSDTNEPPRPDGPADEPTPMPPSSEPPPPAPPGDLPPPPPTYGSDPGQAGYPQPGYGQPDYGQQPFGQPEPGAPGYGAPGERPGGLLDRFLARLIDGVLLAIVGGIIEAILAAAFGVSVGGLGIGGSYAYAAIAAVISTVINLGYFGYLESSRGQSVGKMALRLRVQTMSGGLPTFEQAVKRNIWLALPILGLVPLLGSLVASLGELVAVIMIAVGISNDPVMRRPWTDKYAETRVLKVS